MPGSLGRVRRRARAVCSAVDPPSGRVGRTGAHPGSREPGAAPCCDRQRGDFSPRTGPRAASSPGEGAAAPEPDIRRAGARAAAAATVRPLASAAAAASRHHHGPRHHRLAGPPAAPPRCRRRPRPAPPLPAFPRSGPTPPATDRLGLRRRRAAIGPMVWRNHRFDPRPPARSAGSAAPRRASARSVWHPSCAPTLVSPGLGGTLRRRTRCTLPPDPGPRALPAARSRRRSLPAARSRRRSLLAARSRPGALLSPAAGR